jgi:hypothetical protein
MFGLQGTSFVVVTSVGEQRFERLCVPRAWAAAAAAECERQAPGAFFEAA